MSQEIAGEPAEAIAPAPVAAPVEGPERISSVDVLRGFALLGILLLNIVGFAHHPAAYDNPTIAGGATGINLWTWFVLHVLAEGKMRCIFSMVFGASMFILTSRLTARGAEGADVYYRRLLWLVLFGVIHAYLLWWGEILYPYAILGLTLYPFRKLSPKALLIIAGVLVLLNIGANVGRGFYFKDQMAQIVEIEALEKAGKKLTEEQAETRKDWDETRRFVQPTPEEVKKNVEIHRGGFLGSVKERAKMVGFFHRMPLYHPMNWDLWSMMIIGIALMKLGVFSAAWSYRFYGWLAVIGYAVGLTVNSITGWIIIQHNFDPVIGAYCGAGYDIGRLTVALAHMSLLMMICKAGLFSWLRKSLVAVGQMAFSNYVMHSVICSTLVYGYGFGLYGKLERYQLMGIVAAIWLFQLVTSPIWLRYYRFGPLEWAWRSLTYWKRQPFRVSQPQPVRVTGIAPETA
jgi:uncharacterized protein